MTYFYVYIFILSILIIIVGIYNSINLLEGFNTNKTYVLLGDSIIKNNAYVSNGKSIETLVIERNKQTYSFAEDNSKISDIFIQVNKIPISLNDENTYIFLSAGGNNILAHYVEQNNDYTDSSVLKPMFGSYKNLIKSIQSRLPKAKIILLDIYYPNNLQYTQFHSIIKEWNDMIYNFAANQKNKIYSVIKISKYLTKADDFSFGIEPSSSGGGKIADLITSV